MVHYCTRRILVMFFLILILPASVPEVYAAPLSNSVQRYKVHQPSYNFDFDVYRTSGVPDTWFKTYDGYFVTRRLDQNWVYGRVNGPDIINTNILVGSVNPSAVKELQPVSQSRLVNGPDEPQSQRKVFDFNSPEPNFVQERAWDEIPWVGGNPPEDKLDFAERIYTTMKNAMSSRRNAYMLYGEPLDIRETWQPSGLFKEVQFPGDWGENITWANDKRGILWWSKWHVFGISTYGSKVFGAWILDSGFGYNDHRIQMSHFWKWYDGRILLFNHFFRKKPIYDDEMAIWVLNKQYLFILVPNIDIRVKGQGDLKHVLNRLYSRLLNPFEWIKQPFLFSELVRHAFGRRPTDKNLLYYMVRLSEVPDEVTLNQTIRALSTPMTPGDVHEAFDLENAEAAEIAQARRKRQREEQQE